MRLTVLGSSASYAGPGQACSGHLIQSATGTAILLDCGNGVVSNLGTVFDPLGLDAVFVTHEHVDHLADIYALQALLRYAPAGPAAPLDLYAPEGVFERLKSLLSEHGAEELDEAFRPHHLADGQTVLVGDLAVEACAVDHVDPTYSLRVAGDGVTLAYTSDTANSERVAAAMRGADLVLAEATLPERYADAAPHLTARQAGDLAREAGAGALVLTHLWPTTDRGVAGAEAAEAFGAPVSVARELDVFDVAAARR